MSGKMYGANVDELERIAKEFRRSADEIDGEGNMLTGVLNRVAWMGDIATTFLGDWSGISMPKIGVSTGFLRDAAKNLEGQARQQREASNGGGGGAFKAELTPYQQEVLNAVEREARDQAGKTPAEQAEWWNGLTDEERYLLTYERPGLIMTMGGLPPDVRTTAQEQYCSDAADKVVVSTETYKSGAKVGVWKIVNAGVDVTAQKTVYSDGSADVTLTGAALGGAGIPGIGASEGPMATATYSFDSQADADRFLAQVAAAGGAGSLVPFVGGPALSAVLAAHQSDLANVGGGVTGNVSGASGPATGKAEASAVATVDRNGNVTYTATGSAAYNVASSDDPFVVAQRSTNGPVSVVEMWGDQEANSSALAASVTVGPDGRPQSVTLTQTTMTGTSSGLHGPFQGTETNGTGQTTSIELDLNDPVVAAQAEEIVAAVQRGDVEGALGQIGASANTENIIDRSTVTTSTFDSSSTDVAFDVIVASGAGGVGNTETTSVTVKPPGGEPQVIMGG